MNGQTVNCETCENRQPELIEENYDAWELWLSILTQWRMAECYKSGIDYNAVDRIARVLNIDITPAMLHKIQGLELASMERERELGKGAKTNGGD